MPIWNGKTEKLRLQRLTHENRTMVAVQFAQYHARLGKNGTRLLGDGILFVVDNLANAGIDDHLGTHQTRRKRYVDGRTFRTDAMVRRLRDGVLFRMGTNALPQTATARNIRMTTRTTAIATIPHTAGCPVVSRRNNPAILYDHGGNIAPATIATGLYDMRNVHEVGVPIRTPSLRMRTGMVRSVTRTIAATFVLLAHRRHRNSTPA